MEEIEQLHRELEKTRLAYQMAMQINQFKTGFLARTAHEIRSPLSSLMGLHQLILADLCENTEEEREFLSQAYQAAQRLIKIIDEIILVSKLEYGRISLQKEAVNLAEIFDRLLPLVHLQAANKNLTIQIKEDREPIIIVADEQRLLLSLVNLIDTAISWMEQGKIEIDGVSEELNGMIKIKLDCDQSIWQESQGLLQQSPPTSLTELKQFAQQLEMSAGEKYLLAFNLIEAMGGKLSLENSEETPNLTELCVVFPLILSGI